MSARRVVIPFLLTLIAMTVGSAQTPDAGGQVFVARCAGCHGSDGNGGELGPAIATRVPARTDEDLTTLFRQGLPGAGMPAFANLTDAEVGDADPLPAHAAAARRARGPRARRSTLAGGGVARRPRPQPERGRPAAARRRSEAPPAPQERRPVSRRSRRRPTGPATTAQTSGSRYSPLTQITKSNVATLAPKWIFSLPQHVAPAGDAGRRRTA